MTITATLPATMPNRQQEPAVFVPAMDEFIAALPVMAEQIDIAIAAFNFNSVTDTSATSNSISLGSNKTFIVSLGKSFSPGMYLVIADTAAPTTNSVIAQVFSYAGTALVVTPLYIRGSGTKTAWLITQGAAPQPLIAGASKLLLQTGNGRGTTNLKIRRFTTTTTNTATADVTYADSATLGMSVTVLTAGIYSLQYEELYTASSTQCGISRNSTQLSDAFNSITATAQIAKSPAVNTGANDGARAVYTGYLAAGDVVRAHFGGTVAATGDALACNFYLERLI